MKKFALLLGLFLTFATTSRADNRKLTSFEQEFQECSNTFETEKKKCSESWSMKCYQPLLNINKNAQQCYKKVAIDLFLNFYGLSEKDAEEKFNTYRDFIYEQYFFIFSETNYCKKNNCGVSLYLYSEYATTQQLYDYVSKIIGSISARN